MFGEIRSYLDDLKNDFGKIPQQRKDLLIKISEYISKKRAQNNEINLVYICTHNSRRSHYGQIWAKVASVYYGINHINTFSGGTETTAFNINAINALKRVGFDIKQIDTEKNSTYHVLFAEDENPIICFSKVYNHSKNPQTYFAAIMTCSDAEENCPFIQGVELRIGTTYDDPKAFDGLPQQDEKYDERCKQIALETLYVFSKVK